MPRLQEAADVSRREPARVRILNVSYHNLTRRRLFEMLSQGVVLGANVELVMQLQEDEHLYAVYDRADYVLEDGQILMWLSRLLGTPFAERLSGSDIFPAFCRYHRANSRVKVFLLGGEPSVAPRAMEAINEELGRQIVVGAYSPPFRFERIARENDKIVDLVEESGANVLGVGVGSPKQELWIDKHRSRLPGVDIFFSLGATIDFMAGHKKRAPVWLHDVGLEWLFRLCHEPRRLWRRYLLHDPAIFWLILKQKLGTYRDPLAPSTE